MYGFGRDKKHKRSTIRRKIWLAPQLNKRVDILEPSQDESTDGGFNQTYTTLKSIWAGVKPVSHTTYVRWSSIEEFDSITHEIIIRRNSVDDLHTAFSYAFGTGFDSIADLNPIKSNLYMLLNQGSGPKGRLFRLRRAMDVGEKREYISILAEEVEERGTGFSNG